MIPVRDRLIFALDVPTAAEARAWVDRLGDSVGFYKIGMELLTSGDYFRVLEELAGRGKQVFVDLKFHDVPATVAATIRGLARYPVSLCTIHGQHDGMMRAASQEKGHIKLLAVTVLTSMDRADLQQLGIDREPGEVVVERALAAREAGCDGVIASGQEAGALRQATGPDFLVVCPGIRPAGPSNDDQKRTVDVPQAFAAGADHIVVGRPIRLARDPAAAAEAIQAQIAQALRG
ncbi:orotidine-5'-phosphate decarboxylase [Arenimonas sp. MALMAid1274]|uniref:orotidine-5'-phosphate decarboxylase n=1 Tax=Arenimonas sp. MALMAid1274 TaxID=3411630 RepID=UPI003BA0C017